ncbi:MAG: TolC family protein [Acidobacteriota bacterium]|nr:TolC family protein [Acidobacteriota bacterium]
MRFLFAIICMAAVPILTFPSAYAQVAGKNDGLGDLAALFDAQPKMDAHAPALTLDEAERIALERNPEIAAVARKVATSQAHVATTGKLDDPMAMYRGWGVPLNQPGNFNAAQNMFSISQSLPGAGKRPLQTSIARSDVEIAKSQLDQARLAVRVRVRKAFNDLLLTQEEMRIHDEHVDLARQAIEAARIKYAVGKVSQQDILKAQVTLTALAEHMIRFDQDADLARARLNTLLCRDPDTPIRALGKYRDPKPLPDLLTLKQLALNKRPDLQGAGKIVERSRKEEALTRKTMVPDFTVSAGYMLMPPSADMRNSYMLEGQMSLPWLNRGKHNAEIAEATAKVYEQSANLDALRNSAFGEIQEALVEARAAQRLSALYQDHLRPQAEATLQSSVIAYENDKTDFLNLLDSQMVVINIDLAWLQASADFETRLADLEMATGTVINATGSSTPEVKP